MYQILIINILIFIGLFLIDKQPIKVIIDYIFIVINLSLLLSYNHFLFDLSFFSIIFIIVYASALAILFGIVIMLYDSQTSALFNLSNRYHSINEYLIPLVNPIVTQSFQLKFLSNLTSLKFFNLAFYSFIFFGFCLLGCYPFFLNLFQLFETSSNFFSNFDLLFLIFSDIFNLLLIYNLLNLILILFTLLIALFAIIFILI